MGSSLVLTCRDARRLDPALVQLGRVTQRRADDVAHTWLALDLVARLWHARGMGPPVDFESALGMETSELLRLMRWVVSQSPDAAGWWDRLEDALGDGPELREGQPDGRWDVFFCGSCGEVVNAEARGRRWCLACEGDVAHSSRVAAPRPIRLLGRA